MVSTKNEDITNTNQNFKIHEKDSKKRLRLYVFRSQKFIKTYHPLKQRNVKLHKLRFTSKGEEAAVSFFEKIKNKKNALAVTSEKQTIISLNNMNPVNENVVIKWLTSVGIEIKQISSTKYLLKDRICFFKNVLILANKTRVEMGLPPFYIDNISEF